MNIRPDNGLADGPRDLSVTAGDHPFPVEHAVLDHTAVGPDKTVALDRANGEGGPCLVASFQGQSYHFCNFELSWFDASAYCGQMWKHLVSIHSAQENVFLSATAANLSTDRWWMGFNDLDQEGVWVWSDGAPANYSDWEPDTTEPNGETFENCGQLLRFYPAYTWNDEPCDQPLRFICE